MTNFLHWRKMTWALVLWSGYVATWAVITGSGPAIVTLWWLVGMIVFRLALARRAATVPKRRGLTGFFVRPGRTNWRVVNLHRTHGATEPPA